MKTLMSVRGSCFTLRFFTPVSAVKRSWRIEGKPASRVSGLSQTQSLRTPLSLNQETRQFRCWGATAAGGNQYQNLLNKHENKHKESSLLTLKVLNDLNLYCTDWWWIWGYNFTSTVAKIWSDSMSICYKDIWHNRCCVLPFPRPVSTDFVQYMKHVKWLSAVQLKAEEGLWPQDNKSV